jgi:hypothetical protein
LPCYLGVGIDIAQRIFKKNGINSCDFGKTGTLTTSTEDNLNIAGFLPVEAHHNDD